MPTLTVNGHQVTVDDSFLKLSPDDQNATVDEIVKSLPADKPSGVVAGLREGASDLIHGVAETAKQYLGSDTTKADAAAQKVAPTNYKGADIVPEGGHWYDPSSYNYSQIPQAMAEAAPGMATDFAAAKVASRIPVIGKYAGPAAGIISYLARTRGTAAKADAVARTGDANAEPEAQDKTRSLLTGAAESVPQALGIGRFLPGANVVKKVGQAGVNASAKKLIGTALTEGATGAATNAIGQAGQTIGTPGGLKVDPAQVVDAGITSGATGGALAAPRGIADARGAVKYAKYGDANALATAAMANRVVKAADGQNIGPQGITGDTSNAFNAMRTASGAVQTELKAAVKPIKDALDADTLDALQRAGKGQELTKSDLTTIDQNVPPDVAFLARQAHVSALMKNEGDYGDGRFSGGVTNAMLGGLKKAPVLAGAVGGVVGINHYIPGIMYAPHAAAVLGAGYLGMRGVDALTGNRSPLKGIVDRFADPSVASRMPAPQAPATQAAAPPAGPTGPQVPFNPGVAGGNLNLALGRSPWTPAPEAPAAAKMTPAEMNEQVKSALLMASARRRIAAAQAANNAPAAPVKPDVNAMNEQVKSALLMAAARRKVRGQQDAEALASESPIINDNGGLDQLRQPGFGDMANKLLSAARAHAALTRQPEPEEGTPEPAPAPQAPSPPLAPTEPPAPTPAPSDVQGPGPTPVDPLMAAKRALTKITKTAKGKAKVETPEPELDPTAYEPLTDEQKYGRGLTDETFARRELAKELASGKPIRNEEGYMDSIAHDREKRRGILAEIAGDHEADQDSLGDLLEELHHTRRRARARAAIAHFTAKMSPEAATAVRKRLDQSYINGTWNE